MISLAVVFINQICFDFSQYTKQHKPPKLSAEGLLVSLSPKRVATQLGEMEKNQLSGGKGLLGKQHKSLLKTRRARSARTPALRMQRQMDMNSTTAWSIEPIQSQPIEKLLSQRKKDKGILRC